MNCSDCGGVIELGEKYVLKGDGETVHKDEFYELGEAYLNKYDDWAVKTRTV